MKILRMIFCRNKSLSESLVIQITSFFQAFTVSLGKRLKNRVYLTQVVPGRNDEAFNPVRLVRFL